MGATGSWRWWSDKVARFICTPVKLLKMLNDPLALLICMPVKMLKTLDDPLNI